MNSGEMQCCAGHAIVANRLISTSKPDPVQCATDTGERGCHAGKRSLRCSGYNSTRRSSEMVLEESVYTGHPPCRTRNPWEPIGLT